MKSVEHAEAQLTRDDPSLNIAALAAEDHGEAAAVLHEDAVDHVDEPSAREAWLQVILCHLINFNTFGYILSFGRDNLKKQKHYPC
jgi:hypothetical protein